MIWKRRFTKYSPIKAHGKLKPAAASKPSASHSITHGATARYSAIWNPPPSGWLSTYAPKTNGDCIKSQSPDRAALGCLLPGSRGAIHLRHGNIDTTQLRRPRFFLRRRAHNREYLRRLRGYIALYTLRHRRKPCFLRNLLPIRRHRYAPRFRFPHRNRNVAP